MEKHQNDSTALWRLSPGTTGFASAKGNAFEAFLNVSLQTGNGRDYLINEKKLEVLMRNYDQKAEFLPTLWKHFYKQYGALYKFYCLYIIGCSGLLQNNLIWERIKQKDVARSF